eukprot:6184283-Pleurochrysis_carterae.AAC.2
MKSCSCFKVLSTHSMSVHPRNAWCTLTWARKRACDCLSTSLARGDLQTLLSYTAVALASGSTPLFALLLTWQHRPHTSVTRSSACNPAFADRGSIHVSVKSFSTFQRAPPPYPTNTSLHSTGGWIATTEKELLYFKC